MAGLTPTEVGQAIDLIQRLAAAHDLTLLIVEHVMKALMRMCGRIVVLHQGAVLAIETPAEITVNPEVARVYFGARP
jgi:branched-chain amino acid transport system ATP-binding protein